MVGGGKRAVKKKLSPGPGDAALRARAEEKTEQRTVNSPAKK